MISSIIKTSLLILLVTVSSALYTPSYWKKLGKDVTDGILEESSRDSIVVKTECRPVNLNRGQPYDYNGTVRSGYLRVGKGSSVLGFILYGRENTPQSDLSKYPIIIWLNGGPGSSSQIGNLMQLGPFFIKPGMSEDTFTIVRNNFAWTKQYTVLFVDQPVGTGLSYADPTFDGAYVKSMDDVAKDFYEALKQLYQSTDGCFRQLHLLPSQDLIIIGESYAGKYVPAIALRIKQEQQQSKGFLTGLRGVAIGDGFTHPFDILSQVGQFSFNLGLIDYQQRARIEQLIMKSAIQNRGRRWGQLHISFGQVLDFIEQRSGGVNVYDFTQYYNYPTFLIDNYFNNANISDIYNLNKQIRFGEQSSNVYEALFQDFMKPQVNLINQLLRRKTHVLIYNGQNDIIVQTPGTFKWVDRIQFSQQQKFRRSSFTVWKTGTKTSGYIKQVELLTLMTVNNAGHLVPMDQGEAALNMLKTYVKKVTQQKVNDL